MLWVTHLNCIDKSMQFKWVPTTYAFIEVDKNAGSNLKTTELFDCALKGVCAVIRVNTVEDKIKFLKIHFILIFQRI